MRINKYSGVADLVLLSQGVCNTESLKLCNGPFGPFPTSAPLSTAPKG